MQHDHVVHVSRITGILTWHVDPTWSWYSMWWYFGSWIFEPSRSRISCVLLLCDKRKVFQLYFKYIEVLKMYTTLGRRYLAYVITYLEHENWWRTWRRRGRSCRAEEPFSEGVSLEEASVLIGRIGRAIEEEELWGQEISLQWCALEKRRGVWFSHVFSIYQAIAEMVGTR